MVEQEGEDMSIDQMSALMQRVVAIREASADLRQREEREKFAKEGGREDHARVSAHFKGLHIASQETSIQPQSGQVWEACVQFEQIPELKILGNPNASLLPVLAGSKYGLSPVPLALTPVLIPSTRCVSGYESMVSN